MELESERPEQERHSGRIKGVEKLQKASAEADK